MGEELKRLKNRIDWFCENKVNAFSPTISPAPKSLVRMEIESIEEAIRYFHQHGITEIVVQRKYMGSYCDIYLHKDLEKTYFVSRNGHRIDHIDLSEAVEACRDLHNKIDWQGLTMMIIQSEMMPWSALGKGLIENEFEGYLTTHMNHYNHLNESGLYTKIEAVKQSEPYKEYIKDKQELSTNELKKKYPHHIIRQYESLEAFPVLQLDNYKKSIDVYQAQIEHFGKTEKIYFKPFNVLKKIYEDGKNIIVNDNLSYREINEDELLHFPLTSEEELSVAIEKTYQWFETLEKNMEEGIVIKPRQAFINNMPPAFKVRNNSYLTMIYGVNFQQEYEYYLQKRSIARKLECSVNDWMINWNILKVNYADIHKENYLLKNLLFDRMMGEQFERTLDIRL